jgi:phosphate starvation-inducible membrane PsiE
MKDTRLTRLWNRFDALTFFNHVMDLFFKCLIFFVVLVLGIGLVRLFWEVWKVMAVSELKEAFGFTVTNLLTFFIILEIFKSLVEYFREHRLKLTFIVDATLVFILRGGHDRALPTPEYSSSGCRSGFPRADTRRGANLGHRLLADGAKDGRTLT